jgi:enoyl-[acyl-carrier protein] reductase I
MNLPTSTPEIALKCSSTDFGNLAGKTAVVLGVADRESLAWSIACALHRSGAQVTIGYQHKFYSRVRILIKEYPNIQAQRCDITNPDELEIFFAAFKPTGIDVLIHSIAFGPPNVFSDLPSRINAADFSETLEISAHSLAKVVGFAKPYLKPWASVVTLTFQASQRAMPMYGMMGVAKAALESLVRYLAVELGTDRIRVNAISAGPIQTLAAMAEIVAFRRNPEALKRLSSTLLAKTIAEISQTLNPEADELLFAQRCWAKIQNEFALHSAIPEHLVADDIADSVLFFASDASRKITGQILHVDCGFSACQPI